MPIVPNFCTAVSFSSYRQIGICSSPNVPCYFTHLGPPAWNVLYLCSPGKFLFTLRPTLNLKSSQQYPHHSLLPTISIKKLSLLHLDYISIVPYFLPYFTNSVTYISSLFILDCMRNRYDVLIISVSHVSANEFDKRN